MSDIRYNSASSTYSQVLMAGLFTFGALNVSPTNVERMSGGLTLSRSSYSTDGSSATYDSIRGGITGEYDCTPVRFEQAVGNFYASLLSSQESLGVEFQKVLYDNLWDLYES